MAKRPVLPLETHAAIERAVQEVLSIRDALCPHLFNVMTRGRLDRGMYAYGLDPWRFHPQHATLKSELQLYAMSLFLAEGEYYVGHARDESELRERLSSLAPRVEAEVIAETDQWAYVFNQHCPALERHLTVAEVLRGLAAQWTHGQPSDRLRNTASEPSGAASSGSDAGPAGTLTIPAECNGKGRKGGPKSDREAAVRVVEIVARVAPDGDWRTRLDDICQALDEVQVPYPKRWSKRDRSCRGWADYDKRANAVKAIEYRLTLAKQRKKAVPKTLS